MEFQQQFSQFQTWAMDFHGPSQKWMWSALVLLLGYILGFVVSHALKFLAGRLSGLRHGKVAEGQPKTADHIIVEIFGGLLRATIFLVALAIAANLLIGFPLEQAEALGVAALRGFAILVGVWFLGSWLGSRVRGFGQKLGKAHNGSETLFNFLGALVRFGAFAVFATKCINPADAYREVEWRAIILIATAGSALDYVIMANAPTLSWLVFARIIAGFTGGVLATANAYIADVTPPEKRAGAFGMLGAAFGIGFIIGPALGGLLGEIDLRLPFFAAGVLALACTTATVGAG